eukprot:m51a1_g5782 hypothetical protein (362) ;mRNA; r:106-3380
MLPQDINTFQCKALMVLTCAVLAKAKQFDDGLLAAVQLLVHKGHLSKAPILAAHLWKCGDELGRQVLGFYTWSEELCQVYVQDSACGLESLLKLDQAPEASKLCMTTKYHEGLKTLFALAMALTRETHVKDLAVMLGICCALRCRPVLLKLAVFAHLSVEPLAECYLRQARSYEFVHSVLEDCFQPEELAGLHRLHADDQSVKKPLLDELRKMKCLLRGLHGIVMHELGFMRPEQPEATTEDEKAVRNWLRWFKDDSNVAKDARMMVPLFYDDEKFMRKLHKTLVSRLKELARAVPADASDYLGWALIKQSAAGDVARGLRSRGQHGGPRVLMGVWSSSPPSSRATSAHVGPSVAFSEQRD